MVFLSWLVSGAWTCHRSVVQIRHLYPPTELIEIYNLRPIPQPWHRDKAQLSSKNWRHEGPPTSTILLKNRLFPDLTIWIYAEFYGDFHCAIEKFPSPSKWWVISDLLFYKKLVKKNVEQKKSNPLFYGQNFTEMKIPGSKNWCIGTKSRKKPIFDPIFFDIFIEFFI